MAIQEQAYIGGPMRGIRRFNFDAFDSMNLWLQNNRRWHVHNPATHDRQEWPDIETWEGFEDGDTDRCPKFDLSQALSWDLARVAESQHLVLLPGWEASTGARHERHVAELTGSSIWQARRMPSVGADEWKLWIDMSRESGTAEDWMRTHSLQPTPTPAMPDIYSSAGWAPGTTMAEIAGQQAVDAQAYLNGGLKVTDIRAQGHAFTTKDSGVRRAFDSGMVRDTDEGKPRYDLIPLLPLRRLAELYARGAVKYGDSNWQKANSDEELQRFKASAFRHLVQALDGDRDEDHWSGVVFNVFAAEWLEDRLSRPLSVEEMQERSKAAYDPRKSISHGGNQVGGLRG